MNQQQLKELHALVWAFRQQVSEFWPTPEPDDALRYDFTEAGESIDALLRSKRPHDKRNNSKDHDRLDEWADCAIMLMTAVSSWKEEWAPEETLTDEQLCLRVAAHMVDKSSNVQWTVSHIAALPDINLTERVISRLLRITYNHIPAYKQKMITNFLSKWSHEHAI